MYFGGDTNDDNSELTCVYKVNVLHTNLMYVCTRYYYHYKHFIRTYNDIYFTHFLTKK